MEDDEEVEDSTEVVGVVATMGCVEALDDDEDNDGGNNDDDRIVWFGLVVEGGLPRTMMWKMMMRKMIMWKMTNPSTGPRS